MARGGKNLEQRKKQSAIRKNMKDIKTKDLATKSVEELEEMLLNERAALYKSRRDLVFRQNSDTTGIKVRRHNMARILTMMSQKKRGNS